MRFGHYPLCSIHCDDHDHVADVAERTASILLHSLRQRVRTHATHDRRKRIRIRRRLLPHVRGLVSAVADVADCTASILLHSLRRRVRAHTTHDQRERTRIRRRLLPHVRGRVGAVADVADCTASIPLHLLRQRVRAHATHDRRNRTRIAATQPRKQCSKGGIVVCIL